MRADVAVPDRAENRIGQRMQPDIGVRMARERLVVRDADAVQPDVIAVGEGVDVEPVARPHVAQCRQRAGKAFADGEIGRIGQLHIVGLSWKDEQGMTGPFGDRTIIGQRGHAGCCGAPVRGEDQLEIEGLRRLHGAQMRARGGLRHASAVVHCLDRVGDRHAGHGRAMLGRRGDRAVDQVRGGEGPRGIVDQHDVRLCPAQGLETVATRCLAAVAADRRVGQPDEPQGG